MITNYFGTSTREAGHYLKKIQNGFFVQGIDIYVRDMPFHPEEVTRNLQNGEVHYFHSKSKWGEFTVCAIAGSCFDTRPGCKSVFWVKENISFDEIKERILSTACCKEIIDKMPFKVIW